MPFRDSGPGKSSLVRSRSFGGLLNSKSLTAAPPMLGQSFRSPQMPKKSPNLGGLSFSRKTKLPKVPRPQRVLLIFEHVKRGVGECIAATENDIQNMRASEEFATSSTGQARVLGIEKQIKAAERYKKKLEFHLSKIEELEDHYKLHQELREGVKTMAKAYESQVHSAKKSSLFNVKAGYKECSQVMCAVEAQLENLMGSFHCQMQGLIGFARMVPGDVYEVVIRHGAQKWRCKGRIGLTQQTWDSDAFTFKALVGDVFNIKASELRSLSSVTLGHKNCEVKDLFSSHPQLMTVSLNTNGSIKLNLVCTWNPLDGVDESYSPIGSITARVNVPKPRPQSMYVMGSDSLSDLGSNLSSPDSSLHLPSSRQRHVMPDTNFKLASFLSPITTGGSNARNYALPDHSIPHGPTARPKSIAVMGTIDEMAAGGYRKDDSNPSKDRHNVPMYDFDIYHHHSIGAHYDPVADLRRDLNNYTPRSYGHLPQTKFNPLSLSERDLSVFTPRSRSFEQNPHFDGHYAMNQLQTFSPNQNSPVVSPERYGSQPRLTAVASAHAPQYGTGSAQSPYMSSPPLRQNRGVYTPRPFSYTEAHRFDMSDLADVLNSSRNHPHHDVSPNPLHSSPPHSVTTSQTNCHISPNSRQLSHSNVGHSQNQRNTSHHSNALDTTKGEGDLEAAMTTIKCSLEEYQRQYTELRALEEQVHYLDRLLKKNCTPQSPKSEDGGISIEDALNAFDFLDTEEEEYIDGFNSKTGPSHATSLDRLEAKCTSLSPESTARTSDSGIECLASRLNEDHAHLLATESVSTGNVQIDRVLVWHLAYCQRLLQNLGSFGPLQCKERKALEKLRNQADIIEHLVTTAKKQPTHIKDLQTVLSSLTKDKHVKRLWVLCTDSDVLFTSVDRFLAQIDKSYGEYVKSKSDISPSLVFRTLLSRILDLPNLDPKVHCPNTLVTMYQVIHYFNSQEKCDVQEILQKLAGELWITRGLKSGNAEQMMKTLATLKATLPPAECLRCVVILLTESRPHIREAATSYLQSISGKPGLRRQAVLVLLEALEESSAELRTGACVALRILAGKECIRELTYLCHNDPSLLVQQRARETLFSLGVEGRQAFHDSQLESHGFQGVTMYL